MSVSTLASIQSDIRHRRLIRELTYAWQHAPNNDLKLWMSDLVQRFLKVVRRRLVNLGGLLLRLGKGTSFEALMLLDATLKGKFGKHLNDRGALASNKISQVISDTRRQLNELRATLKENPGESVPTMLVGVVAFLATSGGPDANGGVPDLDLKLGIGAHRSVYFHSIVAGSVMEVGLYGLATFVGLVHQYLPVDHDPLWDSIARNKDVYLTAVAQGASAGIAYHLFVDGSLQQGTYHGLPPMPQEAQDALFVANAAAEGLDAVKKKSAFLDPSKESPRRSPQYGARGRPASERASANRHRITKSVSTQPLTSASEREKHLAILEKRMKLSESVGKEFPSAARAVLEKLGCWLAALESGVLQPITPDQEHFVNVCKGRVEPVSDLERLWIRYRKL